MRRLFLVAVALAGALGVVSTGLALEKTAMRVAGDSRGGAWAASATCTVQYYNICTGWVWVWSGWSPGDRIGTAFADCGGPCSLESSFMFFTGAVSAGRGFTGYAHVYAADANECPTGAPLQSQALLPVSLWNLVSWGGTAVPGNFIVSYEFASDQGLPNPLAHGSEHPAAGPTGPQACGACYPTVRTNHSFYWGTAASPVCPGSVLNDGVCHAQWLMDAAMSCTVSVEDQSWGAVKNLYR